MNTAILSADGISNDNELKGTIHVSNSLKGEVTVEASVAERVQHYKNRAELPALGSASVIYIIDSENATYRWDNSTLTYYCIGRDWKEIQGICGGKP